MSESDYIHTFDPTVLRDYCYQEGDDPPAHMFAGNSDIEDKEQCYCGMMWIRWKNSTELAEKWADYDTWIRMNETGVVPWRRIDLQQPKPQEITGCLTMSFGQVS